ncbi:cysteine hydrolase family protein [Pelagibius sp.]|uniref:cysteine hydrolase family protein n=1 Tax=Pelagibius sp. TaxID=1931238 RepID=UPI003B50FBAB
MLASKSVLMPIDIQQAFDDPFWGRRNNPEMERKALALIAAWRGAGRPVVNVKHNSVEANSPLRPERRGNAFKPGFGPRDGEALVEKTVNAAFIGTGLEADLRKEEIEQIVVFGFTTDKCVSTTVRVGSNLGFEVLVVADACATFDLKTRDRQTIPAEVVHRVHLTTLNTEFARVVDSPAILSALG